MEDKRKGSGDHWNLYGPSEDLMMAGDDAELHEFLTDAEVADRYRGLVSLGTLRNWRSLGAGPPFLRIGRAVLYRLADLRGWEATLTVRRGSKSGS